MEHFNLLNLLSCNFNNCVTLASTRLRLPEDDADTLKHVAVLTVYKMLLIYIAHLRQECHNLKFGIFELLV